MKNSDGHSALLTARHVFKAIFTHTTTKLAALLYFPPNFSSACGC